MSQWWNLSSVSYLGHTRIEEKMAKLLKHEKAEIQDFVVAFFESIDALVEFSEYALAEVIVPDEYADIFDGRSFLKTAFDPEVAAENPDAEFVTYGSYLLDTITALTVEKGITTVRYIVVDRFETARIEEKLTRQFSMAGVTAIVPYETYIRNFSYALFNFKIVYLTDEREEVFDSVLVNLNTNSPAEKLEERINIVSTSDKCQIICPEVEVYPIDIAYRTACRMLRRRAETEFEDRQRENRLRLSEDLERINRYYDDLREELWERLEKEKVKEDEDGAATILRKIEANDLDRKRRIAELEDKYRLRIEIKLNSAVVYFQPKVVHHLFLRYKRGETPMDIVWNPILKEFEPPICKLCGEQLMSIELEHNGSVRCWGKGRRN